MKGAGKLKVFVGTVTEVARMLASAQGNYDRGTAHVCGEDGNPYHVMLEWKPSKDHDACPDCGRASHKRHGHWCSTKQAMTGGDPDWGKASEADLAIVSVAFKSFLSEHGGQYGAQERREFRDALKRVNAAAMR